MNYANSSLLFNEIKLTWIMFFPCERIIFESITFNRKSWDKFMVIGKCICHHVHILLPLLCGLLFMFFCIYSTQKYIFSIVYKYIVTAYKIYEISEQMHLVMDHHKWHLYINLKRILIIFHLAVAKMWNKIETKWTINNNSCQR